jgi:hypothetical protein
MPQAGRERIERPGRVVAGAVEASVHCRLDPGTNRPEEGRGGERGRGDGQTIALGDRMERRLQHEDSRCVDRAQRDRQDTVDQRPLIRTSMSYSR